MPDTHSALRARFAYVREDLEALIDHLADSDLPWSPAKGMPTVADLLLEIANKEREAPIWLQTGTWPEDCQDVFDVRTSSVSDIRAALHTQRAQTLAYIDSLSEAELERDVPNPDLWWEGLRRPECPLGEVLRNIAAHEWYHTAQLITYLWIRGRNPNDW